ncbi:MAG: FtsX-like permease family protein [Bacteroidales bacterium]|nr:FtsX-like permease family protein [Bacteroidales bacterium]
MTFRNLLYYLRKYKIAAFLNLAGMAVALAALIIIAIQLKYEASFNHCHENYERIVRYDFGAPGAGYYAVLSYEHVKVGANHPLVEEACVMYPYDTEVDFRSVKYPERVFQEMSNNVSYNLPKVFTFNMKEGSSDCLKEPGKLLISETLANKAFPGESALGQIVSCIGETLQVGGVYYDFPAGSTLRNIVYRRLDTETLSSDWGSSSYNCYLLLKKGVDPKNCFIDLKPYAKNFWWQSAPVNSQEEFIERINDFQKFTPLDEVYYDNKTLFAYGTTSSKTNTMLLVFLGFIVLVVATINMNNFHLSLVPLRVHCINTLKVMGASVKSLRYKLTFEAILINLLAMAMAIGLVIVLKGTSLNSLVAPGLSLTGQTDTLLIVLAFAVVAAIAAGLYPAINITSFQPAMALKGSFGLSPKGRKLRVVLLCFQNAASMALVTLATFLMLQNAYISKVDYGYDKEQLVDVVMNSKMLDNKEAFRRALLENPDIEEVAFGFNKYSASDEFTTSGKNLPDMTTFQFINSPCSMTLPQTLGLDLLDGRFFIESEEHGQGAYVVTESFAKMVGLKVGTNFWDGIVVGICSDFCYHTLHKETTNFAFYFPGDESWLANSSDIPWLEMVKNCYIRTVKGADMAAVKASIQKTLSDFDPYFPFNIITHDEVMENAYMQEKKPGTLITIFSILSIIISIVGVVSIAIFDSQYRRREVAVRKVFGSKTADIIRSTNIKYAKVMVVAAVIAVPVSYIIVNNWMARFTIHVPMLWWVFALSVVVVSGITLATITLQSLKAASANPVENLRG